MVGTVLAEGSSGGAFSVVIFLVVSIVGFIAYWVPTVVALVRKVPNKGSVIVINAFLGWTLIGWVVALAMAARSKPTPMSPSYP